MKVLILLIAIGLASAPSVQGQVPPPPPPPVKAKPTPPDKSEVSEADFQAKLLESLGKPIAWKQYSLPGFDISVDMPREPVRQAEAFYDESVGNAKIEMYMSFGEGSSFMMARMPMPYAIIDRKLLREMFEEVAKELISDPSSTLKYAADYELDGFLGVELNGVPKDGYLGARFRGIVVGKSLYMIFASPHHSPPDDDRLSKEELDSYRNEHGRFFSSIVSKLNRTVPTSAAQAGLQVPPIFRSTFLNGVFRSEYFKFSLSVPANWLLLSQEDVDGMRQVGLDYVAANSEVSVPKLKARQNLATFVSKPLGSEGIAMIAFNIGPKSESLSDAQKLADATAGVVARMPTYEIKKRPTPFELGGLKGYTLENAIKLAAGTQNQTIYFLQRRDHILVVVVTFFDEADRRAAITALENLKLEAL